LKAVVSLALVVATLATLGPAPATAAGLTLACVVTGSNDVRITNTTGAALPASTIIKWLLKAPHASGKVTLAAPLGPGQSIRLGDALIVGPGDGTPCTAIVINA
jgi:hypothetical protein